MDTGIRQFQERLDTVSLDPQMWRTYEDYERAASGWTSAINGAERKGQAEGHSDIIRLLEKGVSLAELKAAMGCIPQRKAPGQAAADRGQETLIASGRSLKHVTSWELPHGLHSPPWRFWR